MKWKKLKPRQFEWVNRLLVTWGITIAILISLTILLKSKMCLLATVTMSIIGVLCIVTIHRRLAKIRRISNLVEDFIRNNRLYQAHYDVIKMRYREVMDYYPLIEYIEKENENLFCLKFRLDGSAISQKFRDLEQALADMFCTVCNEVILERGFVTYCFELQKQEQIRIESKEDFPNMGENEIAFSESIVWDWKKCPHLLLTGGTGSGKTYVALYIIACLIKQGIRVVYCDPKSDDDMRFYLTSLSTVQYYTKENDIAKAVREIEEEMRSREMDLNNMQLDEAEFLPIFLIFDEIIAFKNVADKRTYDETIKRLSTIILTGRSKRVYGGIILQRGDAEFLGGGAVRDNLMCRISMGHMSETAYAMTFREEHKHVKNYRREVGSGLIYREGIDTKPREFLAPYICNGAL